MRIPEMEDDGAPQVELPCHPGKQTPNDWAGFGVGKNDGAELGVAEQMQEDLQGPEVFLRAQLSQAKAGSFFESQVSSAGIIDIQLVLQAFDHPVVEDLHSAGDVRIHLVSQYEQDLFHASFPFLPKVNRMRLRGCFLSGVSAEKQSA